MPSPTCLFGSFKDYLIRRSFGGSPGSIRMRRRRLPPTIEARDALARDDLIIE